MYSGIKPAGAAAIAVILIIAYAARAVVTPLLCAFLAAFIIEPLVGAIAKKTGRTLAVGLTLTILATACALVLIFLVPRAGREALEAAQAAQQNISSLNLSLQRWMSALPEDIKTQAADALSAFSGKLLTLAANAVGAGLEFLGGVVSAVSKILLFFVGFVFLMLDFPLLNPGLLHILSRIGWDESQVAKFDGFLSESNNLFRAFFRGQLLYALAIGGLTALGLWTIGLPYGLTLGIVVGLLSLIPYVGVTLGILVALAVSFHYDGRLIHLALTGGVFGLVQFIDAVYLTPKLLGSAVGLHPLMAVVSLLAFSQLFGFFGLMLAIPLAAVTLAAVRRLLAE